MKTFFESAYRVACGVTVALTVVWFGLYAAWLVSLWGQW